MLLCVVLSSCHQDKTGEGYSESFKPVMARISVLFGSNRTDEGIRYLDSALNQMHPTNDDRYRAYSYHYVYALRGKNDNKLALLYADSMLYIANLNTKDPQYFANYAEANFAIGDAYFNLQQYNEAYQYIFRGYQTGQHSLNNTTLAGYNYRMGMITYKMGSYKLAANYFKRSSYLHSVSTGNDKFVEFYAQQEILDNIGLSYKHNNQPDSAIVYFNKALNFLNKNGGQFPDRLKSIDMASGVIYGNKAEVLILKGDYIAAGKLLKKSIEINLRKDYDNNDAALTEIKLAQLYYDHNENDALYSLLNTIHQQQDSIKNQDVKTDWNHLMAKYFIRKNELAKALSYLQTYNVLKDSSLKKLDLLRESDVNKQIDAYEKQQEIQDLSVKNKYQTIFLVILTAAAVMTLVIILLIYRNWKRSKEDIAKVNKLNQHINKQNIVLETALNDLKNNNREKDRILRTVAHDLRNPLGGIASLTAMMVDDECSDEQREYIKLVNETAVNSLELINELLEATETAMPQSQPELTDINVVVGNSVELLQFKAAEKDQQISFSPLSNRQNLFINRERISRVLGNLISNAIKFSPESSLINVKVSEWSNQILVAVEDNGIGIPDKLKDQIFNMYTSAQRPGTNGEKSFGLGLSICRQIIELSGGKIWFEDRETGGTTFYISLPIPPAMEKPVSTQEIAVPLAG